MLSKSSFFTTILLLLPAMASAQTADDDLQLELRYYAPKLKFTSHGIVPAAYSNFRDTLNIKNGNAPEYRLSGKNWYVDYIAIHEKGYASHHIPAPGSLIPADSRTKLNLDYASFSWLFPQISFISLARLKAQMAFISLISPLAIFSSSSSICNQLT